MPSSLNPPFSSPLLDPGSRINPAWWQWFQAIHKQQAHEPDAVAVSAISLGAGADTVDRAAFNTALTTLVTEINAIKTVLNNLLLKQETADILASS